MRKPIAAGVFGLVSIVAGRELNASHHPHAVALAAEIKQDEATLSAPDRATVNSFLEDGKLPKDTDPALVTAADKIQSLTNAEQDEEDAGDMFTFIGSAALLYTVYKAVTFGAVRPLVRDEIKRRHPALAPERVLAHVDALHTFGGSVEDQDTFQQKYGSSISDRYAAYDRQRLVEIGHDIEASERFELSTDALSTKLCKMLNKAQWNSLSEFGSDPQEAADMDDQDAFEARIIDDLWIPKDTFVSLKDWYAYRRRQVVKPGAVHSISEGELFLPEIKKREGGIGIALGRIAQHMKNFHDYSDVDRSTAGREMILAIEGTSLLDEIAPREDGSYWFDYVDALGRKTSSTKN
jgi:hypothetical protein